MGSFGPRFLRSRFLWQSSLWTDSFGQGSFAKVLWTNSFGQGFSRITPKNLTQQLFDFSTKCSIIKTKSFLDRHHAWRSLDPTLDIWSNFVHFSHLTFCPKFSPNFSKFTSTQFNLTQLPM